MDTRVFSVRYLYIRYDITNDYTIYDIRKDLVIDSRIKQEGPVFFPVKTRPPIASILARILRETDGGISPPTQETSARTERISAASAASPEARTNAEIPSRAIARTRFPAGKWIRQKGENFIHPPFRLYSAASELRAEAEMELIFVAVAVIQADRSDRRLKPETDADRPVQRVIILIPRNLAFINAPGITHISKEDAFHFLRDRHTIFQRRRIHLSPLN